MRKAVKKAVKKISGVEDYRAMIARKAGVKTLPPIASLFSILVSVLKKVKISTIKFVDSWDSLVSKVVDESSILPYLKKGHSSLNKAHPSNARMEFDKNIAHLVSAMKNCWIEPIIVATISGYKGLYCISGRNRLVHLSLAYGFSSQVPVLELHFESLTEARRAAIIANGARYTGKFEASTADAMEAIDESLRAEDTKALERYIRQTKKFMWVALGDPKLLSNCMSQMVGDVGEIADFYSPIREKKTDNGLGLPLAAAVEFFSTSCTTVSGKDALSLERIAMQFHNSIRFINAEYRWYQKVVAEARKQRNAAADSEVPTWDYRIAKLTKGLDGFIQCHQYKRSQGMVLNQLWYAGLHHKDRGVIDDERIEEWAKRFAIAGADIQLSTEFTSRAGVTHLKPLIMRRVCQSIEQWSDADEKNLWNTFVNSTADSYIVHEMDMEKSPVVTWMKDFKLPTARRGPKRKRTMIERVVIQAMEDKSNLAKF
jgi:hypothetical protein